MITKLVCFLFGHELNFIDLLMAKIKIASIGYDKSKISIKCDRCKRVFYPLKAMGEE